MNITYFLEGLAVFTGIIEEIGIIKFIQSGRGIYQICIKAKKILKDVQIGDSISVNGTCLTVSSLFMNSFSVEVMPETLSKTSLVSLKIGSSVNLERAIAAGDRFGGHIVSGHVDNIGKILERKNYGNIVLFRISVPPGLITYFIPRGSIAVDGISLTVVEND